MGPSFCGTGSISAHSALSLKYIHTYFFSDYIQVCKKKNSGIFKIATITLTLNLVAFKHRNVTMVGFFMTKFCHFALHVQLQNKDNVNNLPNKINQQFSNLRFLCKWKNTFWQHVYNSFKFEVNLIRWSNKTLWS